MHGSLYDPSNPVVKYGGGKRPDLHKKGASRIHVVYIFSGDAVSCRYVSSSFRYSGKRTIIIPTHAAEAIELECQQQHF